MALFIREYLLVGIGRVGWIGRFKRQIGMGIGLTLSLLCLALGQWQICRLGQKNHLQVMIDRSHGTAAVPLGLSGLGARPQDGQVAPPRQDQAVFFKGLWEWDKALKLMPRLYGGRMGYHVLVPVWIPSHGIRLLVNVGWMPQDAPIPVPQNPAWDHPLGGEGYIRLPPKKSFFTPDSTWSTRTVYGIDLPDISSHLDKKAGKKSALRTDFYVLLRTPLSGLKQTPVPEVRRLVLTNNHLSYSVTWHGLALVFFLMTMIEWRHRRYTLHKEKTHHDR